MRSAVSGARRSGLLKANDTAVLDTPAARATSAMRGRPMRWSTRPPVVAARRGRGPEEEEEDGAAGRGANRLSKPVYPTVRAAPDRCQVSACRQRRGCGASAQRRRTAFGGPWTGVGYDGQPMVDRVRAMPGGIRLFLLYAFLILAGIGLA